jgi:hypothetical protein
VTSIPSMCTARTRTLPLGDINCLPHQVTASMVPSLDALPEMKAWIAEDAKLVWKWKWRDEKELTGRFQV